MRYEKGSLLDKKFKAISNNIRREILMLLKENPLNAGEIAGVCGGLAKYFDVSPKVVRWLFVLMFFAFSSGLMVYIILMIFMRKEPKAD